MKQYFCFYHIYQGDHMNYHHVIIEIDDLEVIQRLETPDYMYVLMSSEEIFLSEKDKDLTIIKSLIMDGESLLKRLKKNYRERILERVIR